MERMQSRQSVATRQESGESLNHHQPFRSVEERNVAGRHVQQVDSEIPIASNASRTRRTSGQRASNCSRFSASHITHMGPDFLFVESPTDHPPCEGSIFLRVDESESRWNVRLPDGISARSKRVAIAVSE